MAYPDRNKQIKVFRLNEVRNAVYDSLLAKQTVKLNPKVHAQFNQSEDGKVSYEVAFG